MNSDCLFCRIISGEIPSKTVHSDERLVAFHDVNPQAPLHLLIVPRRHISTLNDLAENDVPLVGEMVRLAADLAKDRGYGEGGYRAVCNCNRDAGQTVFHVHLHLLAGRKFKWPPG